ncbi:MAG: hypothetical protein FWF57_00600 [Defluviitaleaceae bacterium]|nr:hypothetical protein [Defluviitaleaceae bacterium]
MVNNISPKFISDGLFLSGVIGLESATYYHRISNYSTSPCIRLVDKKLPYSWRFPLVYLENTLPLTEDIEHVAGHLYVTNKERTICDMILYECTEEFIYQSIETYLDEHGTEETLMKYADKYKCIEKMKYYITTLDKYLEDEW